jgi:hypothetical protein
MQDQGNRVLAAPFVMIAGFETAGWAVDHDFGHGTFRTFCARGRASVEPSRARPNASDAAQIGIFRLAIENT